MKHMTLFGVLYKLTGGLALGITAMYAQVDFSHTITLGSFLVGIVVVISAGYFGIRNQQVAAAVGAAESWKAEAEAREAKAERLEIELREKIGECGTLKTDLATVTAALDVERAKHDLGTLIEKIQTLHGEAMAAMGQMMEGRMAIVEGQQANNQMLQEIRDAIQGGQHE